MRYIKYIFLVVLAFFVSGCGNDGKKQTNTKKEEVKKIVVPSFNEDSAFMFVKKQVEFGPRVPGTKEHY